MVITKTHQKEYNTNSYIGKDDAHPDLIGQWVQKGEDPRFGLLWFFDHYGDSQRHEGFGEIYHFLSNKSDRQGSNCYICFLLGRQRQNDSVGPLFIVFILEGIERPSLTS